MALQAGATPFCLVPALSPPRPWSLLHPAGGPSPRPQPHATPSLWPLQGLQAPPQHLLAWGQSPQWAGCVPPRGSAPPLEALPQRPGARSCGWSAGVSGSGSRPPPSSSQATPSAQAGNPMAGPSNRPPSPLPCRLHPCLAALCPVGSAESLPGVVPFRPDRARQSQPRSAVTAPSECVSASLRFPFQGTSLGPRAVSLVCGHPFLGPAAAKARKTLAGGKGGGGRDGR